MDIIWGGVKGRQFYVEKGNILQLHFFCNYLAGTLGYQGERPIKRRKTGIACQEILTTVTDFCRELIGYPNGRGAQTANL